MKKKLAYLGLGSLLLAFTACHNSDVEFPDPVTGVSVYFANQYPVRTLVLGNPDNNGVSEIPNVLDNQHKCEIYATMGGSYTGKQIVLDVAIDNSLCDKLYFADGVTPVEPMPANYYQLASNKIEYKGDKWGCVEVQFTDAFFADPKAVSGNYVIPVVIKGQSGADRILTGTPLVAGTNPSRCDVDSWDPTDPPMDYTLYCVRYMNPWQAMYLRRGVDEVTERTGKTTNVRHGKTIEKDEVIAINTRSMTEAVLSVAPQTTTAGGMACDLLLTFNGDKCTVSSATQGVTAQGEGLFVTKGEKKAWGDKDRDALYLKYSIDYGNVKVETTDTLVVQTRATNQKVTFSPKYIQ